MVHDAVANVVMRLMNCGYDPRKVSDDAWESRCPAHRGAEHALAITRNEFNHVTLQCRSAQNCTHSRIVSALGLTNEHVYAETPEGWVRRLAAVPVQSAGRPVASSNREQDDAAGAPRRANRVGGTQIDLPDERMTSRDVVARDSAGSIAAKTEQKESIIRQHVPALNSSGPAPHPVPIPVAPGAMSDSRFSAERVDSGFSPRSSSIGAVDAEVDASAGDPPPDPGEATALGGSACDAERADLGSSCCLWSIGSDDVLSDASADARFPHPGEATAIGGSACDAERSDSGSSCCLSSIGSDDALSDASADAHSIPPDTLPVAERALSPLVDDASRDDRAALAIVGAAAVEPDPVSIVDRAIGDLQRSVVREDGVGSQKTTAELYLPDTDMAQGGYEKPSGGSMGIVFSSISVNVDHTDRLERQSSVQILARVASNASMFRSADGRFCAQVPVGTRQEIYRLRSTAFRDWLIDGYLNDQAEPPSNWAIRRVLDMLEARARFSTGIPEVFVRVGQAGDAADQSYYIDLGDQTGRSVAIGDQGWSIVDRPAIHFRRPKGLLPLPAPARDGSIDLLRKYVNLNEADFRLMVAWLTASLRPVGPYPVLVLNGEQASGKSTLAKILRMLIDPQTCPSLALPNSTRDLMATAVNGWLLLYENITTIPGWLSDCVCQLAFGGGFASRELFSDDERTMIYAQRPVIMVGIDDFVTRADLRDRSVFLHLPAISSTERRSERKFWPSFQADYPRILGGVLDAIVAGRRALPSVQLKELPRMADYAEWGEAVGQGLGWGSETFLSDYNENRKVATEPLLEDSQVASMMLAFGRLKVNWTGTAQKLHDSVTKTLGRSLHKSWPSTPGRLGAELRRIAPQLRLHGLSVSFERTTSGRVVILRTESKPTPASPPNEPSACDHSAYSTCSNDSSVNQ